MLSALEEVEELLRRYGHVYEANLAAIAHAAFAEDPATACRLLNSDEWWNGQRSVAAIDLAVDGGFTAGARRDAQRLRDTLSEIFTTMLAYGERHEAGEIIVSQFRKWRESHI